MHRLERICIQLRHSPWLREAHWLWDRLRTPYNEIVARCGLNGLERVINGTDVVRVLPDFRGVSERYEPEVWKCLMSAVRPGDTVADVGAYIGLYSVALALRAGTEGRLVAFEPDAVNFVALEDHCRLNGVLQMVDLMNVAVGDEDGAVAFETGRACESRVSFVFQAGETVQCVRLDTVFADRKLDVLKIDVEGYEEAVLRGASRLLHDSHRRPRVVFIEAHPYAWGPIGTTSDSLIGYLDSLGYEISDVNGRPVRNVRTYGEIVAQPIRSAATNP